ncbi:motility associated factor glycosyltransferase family protein [Treponema socranskii]|uniref:motility associated factor glycosyltransferase family protein n=1 Tax=Treponema socranskii TaxID=53419 RepID=UPI003D6F29AA
MNSIWNKNRSAFVSRFPSLEKMFASEIAEVDAICKDSSNDNPPAIGQPFPFWNIVSAKDGSLSAYENGVLLHSAYNPKREAEQTVANSDSEGCRAAVFFGFGLGYAVEAYALRFPDRAIIVVEPDADRFFASLALTDWSAFFACKDCIAALACPPHTVVSFIENYGVSRCAFFSVPSQTSHASHYFDTLRTLVERNRRKDDINAATLERFAKRWLKNSCKNLNNYASMRGVSAYSGGARGIPFTIVAAGPSLESVLPHLSEIKKRSIVVCVDTALRACLRAGVEPDFIVVGDPQYYAYRHIAGLTSKSSVLVAEVAVYPSVFSFPCRSFALSSSLFPIGKWFERRIGEKGDLGAGGSVASAAWNFAYAAGAKEIYCCGLDFAFPEKKTHIKGSMFEEGTHETSVRTFPAETQNLPLLFSAGAEYAHDYDGNPVPTDSRMKMFAWWFESRLASCPDAKTYTFARSGIAIPGIEPADMRSFLEKPDIAVQKEKFIKKSEVSEKGAVPDKARFESALADFLREIASLRKIAEDGKRICEKALADDMNMSAADIAAAGKCGTDIAVDLYAITDKRDTAAGSTVRQTALRSLADIDTAILKSSVKDAVSLALPNGRFFIDFAEKGDKTDNAFRETISRARRMYEELSRATSECEKYVHGSIPIISRAD